MVAVLIAFMVNNVVWAVLLIYLVILLQNKSLPKVFKRSQINDPIEEFPDATDEQILKSMADLNKTITEKPLVYDTSGQVTEPNIKEEAIE
jgi:hypothetical protein